MATLAFLFTDIEGSTALLTRLGDARFSTALEDHHRIIRASLERFDGAEQGTQGDSFFAVFTSPSACVAAALEMQRDLGTHPWPDGEDLRVRMGIHTGEASEESTGMVGYEVHRAARIAAVGYGGQILVSSSTKALVEDSLPASATLVDLGPHRLKDLGRPEVIFQLAADGLKAHFPALRSLDSESMPSNLPVQLTSFVGRDTEVRDIAAVLREHRLVTITGAGGVGKTRLALHVAAELLTDSPDGVWFAELASVEDGDGMAEVIARSVGAVRRADLSLTDSILESLRTRQLLLVLDNCEHLLGEVADLVEELLAGVPMSGSLPQVARGWASSASVSGRCDHSPLRQRRIPPRHWPRVPRSGCWSIEPRRSSPTSSCRNPTERRLPRSADAWTGSRWPSSCGLADGRHAAQGSGRQPR